MKSYVVNTGEGGCRKCDVALYVCRKGVEVWL